MSLFISCLSFSRRRHSFFFWDIKSVIWDIYGISKPELELVDLLLLDSGSMPVADVLETDSGKFLFED
ncbi:MAG: hypothetical protein M3M88_00245 [Thermoproteota archaeon]|nr:hypothetical protein [Thermoproteota archaeon]